MFVLSSAGVKFQLPNSKMQTTPIAASINPQYIAKHTLTGRETSIAATASCSGGGVGKASIIPTEEPRRQACRR